MPEPPHPPHPPSPRELRARAERQSRRAQTPRERPARGFYLLRHWRGQVDLATAVILGAALIWGLFTLLRYAQGRVDITERPTLAAVLWLAEVAVLLIGSIWWGTGVFRAAARHRDQGGSSLAAFVAAAAGIAAFGWAGLFWMKSARHHAPEIWAIASGELKPARISVDAARREIVLEGDLEFGSKQALGAALDRHPEVRTVRLESRGGRAAEGLRIGQMLAARGLDTRVTGECSSACVTAFAGGTHRWIARNARLGLHSAGGINVTADDIARVNEEHDRFIYDRGVNWRVLEKGQAVAADSIWFPESVTLLASGLATDYDPAR
jgi:hypothetical protein